MDIWIPGSSWGTSRPQQLKSWTPHQNFVEVPMIILCLTLYILFAPCRYSPGTLRAATEENCICNPEWPFACIGIFSLDQCEWYNIHRMMECFVLYLLCQGFGEKVVYLHMKLDMLWVEKYMMMRLDIFFYTRNIFLKIVPSIVINFI